MFAKLLKKIGVYIFAFGLTMGVLYSLVVYAPGKTVRNELVVLEEETTDETQTILSEEELFDAINELREQYLVYPLRHEESTCALARARVEEIYEKGTNIFGISSSFQRTIDKVFREETFLDANTEPIYYREFLTYEETVEDAIEVWRQKDTHLFDELDYKYGCVAEKDGYAIVIVGYRKRQVYPSKEKESPETKSYPKGIEKAQINNI